MDARCESARVTNKDVNLMTGNMIAIKASQQESQTRHLNMPDTSQSKRYMETEMI